MVTVSATSMYTSIDTAHGLKILRHFLEEFQEEGNILDNFDIHMIVEAAKIVMHWNLF